MKTCSQRTQFLLLLLITLLCQTTSFSCFHTRNTRQHQHRRTTDTVRASDNDNDDDAENPLKGMELTSSLAKIDEQWQIQQRKAPGQSRWTKLLLPKEDNSDNDVDTIEEDPPFPPPQQQQQQQDPNDFVYLLEPSNSFQSTPSCLIVFVGGAGLGQFPQIAYNEFLVRVSNQLNAAVLAAPYTVGLDHFELAKQTGDRLRRAILFCQDDPKRQYPESLPTFALSHSLGCKLQTIYVAATAQPYRGMGFISYNNFGFGQTLNMARTFAEQLRGDFASSSTQKVQEKSDEAFNMIFGMAETVLNAVGLDFSPTAKDTERLIQLKFDADLQSQSRLFVMDQDDLDSSQQFAQNCINGPGPTTSGVEGTHLTPVYFKLNLDELSEDEVTREMAKEFAGGVSAASFGDEGNMNGLVQEVANWVLGRSPSRPAHWDSAPREAPRLTGVDQQQGEGES